MLDIKQLTLDQKIETATRITDSSLPLNTIYSQDDETLILTDNGGMKRVLFDFVENSIEILH